MKNETVEHNRIKNKINKLHWGYYLQIDPILEEGLRNKTLEVRAASFGVGRQLICSSASTNPQKEGSSTWGQSVQGGTRQEGPASETAGGEP